MAIFSRAKFNHADKQRLSAPKQVIHAAVLHDIYALERCSAARSNEVWFYGPYVLRINPHVARWNSEARLLRLLPASIPHAPVVAAGEGWIVQRRVAGDPLKRGLAFADEAKQRAAAQQFAAILINLHQVRISGTPSLSPGWFPAILPADIIKLATQLRAPIDINAELMDAVIRFTRRTMADITPPLRWGFIHRDLRFDHVLWNDDRITALLDFEQAVIAPRELELDMILRFCRYPELYSGLEPAISKRVIGWLQEDYPLLFNEPGIEQRLRLYSIEHDLRALSRQPDSMTQNRLRAVLEG